MQFVWVVKRGFLIILAGGVILWMSGRSKNVELTRRLGGLTIIIMLKYSKLFSIGLVAVVMAAVFSVSSAQAASLESVLNSYWQGGVFHWLTLFESLSGYTVQGDVSLDGTQMTVRTADQTDATSWIIKQPAWQNFLSFKYPSAFRSAFVAGGVKNVQAYLVHGSAMDKTGRSYYGFKLVNQTLWGVASGDGTDHEQSVLLMENISPVDSYAVSAKYQPNKSVVFEATSLMGGETKTAKITNNLPRYTSRQPHIDLVNALVQTKDSNKKSLGISFFEFVESPTAGQSGVSSTNR